jgi:hypothetical protein
MSSPPRVLTSGVSHFFGFHDLTPWNADSDELVCLRTDVAEDHVPTHQDEAEVVIVNEADGTVNPVGRTRAWNWQKAARQRWLPALGRRVIAFNASNAKGFECRLLDLDVGTTRVLPLPLYDISDEHGFGLTLNFRRLVRCQPGYGYDHPSPEPPLDYESDGIFRLDLQTGEAKLILSLAEFLRAHGLDPSLGEHYFTHIQISPDGRRFVFMHRCFLASGGLVNNFVVAKTDGSAARILLDDKMSHFDWRGNDKVIVWCRKSAAIRKLKESKWLAAARALYRLSRRIKINVVRQRLYNECFRQIDLTSRALEDLGRGVLPEDGHPQVNPLHPDIWVNDTYPDGQGLLTLMLYNQGTNRRLDLLRLPIASSILGTNWRCDLHPRWHPRGTRVSFDSSHLGRRQMCVLDVAEEVAELSAGSPAR